jgi:flavodoxin
MANSQSLIAYFSRKGNNYLGCSIVNLPIGNTEVVAHKIQTITEETWTNTINKPAWNRFATY